MTSSPITSWQIDGEKMEIVIDFIFLGSKITVNGDCSHEIKRPLLLRRKAMKNLNRVLKSRDITLPKCVHIVKITIFPIIHPIVMYGCESWTTKKAEHQRIDAFKLWCWRRLLKCPLDCMEIKSVNPKGNQSWIFIGWTDAEAPILWPPNVKSWLFGKDHDTGKDWGQEEKGWQKMRWLDGITYSMNMSLSNLWKIVKDRVAWHSGVHGVTKNQI